MTKCKKFNYLLPLLFVLIFVVGCSNTENTTESEESEESGLSTQQFIDETEFANSALSDAYVDYQKVLENFTIGNFDGENLTPDENASTQTDIINNLNASVESQYYSLNEEESYLFYYYEGGEPLIVGQENSPMISATLSLYFVQDRLTQASVATNQSSYDSENQLLSQDVANDVLTADVSLEELAQSSPTLSGMSRMVFEDQAFDVFAIPVETDSGNQMLHMPIVSEETIRTVNTVSVDNANASGLENVLIDELVGYYSVEILGMDKSELTGETSLPTLHNYDELSANFDALVETAKESDVTAEQVSETLGEPTNQNGTMYMYQAQADNGDMYNVNISFQDDIAVMFGESWDRQNEENAYNFTQQDIENVSMMSADSTIDDFIELYGQPTTRTYIPAEDLTIYDWESPSPDAEVALFQVTINSSGTVEQIGYQ